MIYNGILWNNLPIIPLIIPINPQDNTCQIVHIPIPKNIFDKNVTTIDNKNAEQGPRIIPQIIISAVTGCTFGKNANNERTTTDNAAKIASKVSLYVFKTLLPRLQVK